MQRPMPPDKRLVYRLNNSHFDVALHRHLFGERWGENSALKQYRTVDFALLSMARAVAVLRTQFDDVSIREILAGAPLSKVSDL